MDTPGCWSHVGRQGGMQKIQLSEDRCYTKESLTHEMIHAVGHYHEHTRLDRDQHIKVNLSCVLDSVEDNFDVQKNTESYGLPYDHYSIMHYNRWQGAIHPTCKTMTSLDPNVADDDLGKSTEMTELDVKKISTMQQCTIPCKYNLLRYHTKWFILLLFIGNKMCDSICTFNHECQFDEVCKNRECVKDNSSRWHCNSGYFDSPEMACRRINKNEG